jgi:hypothetical protein
MPPRTSGHTDPWQAFSAALLARDEQRPDGTGWMTFKEIQAKYKKPKDAIYRALRSTPHEVFNGLVNRNGKLIRCVWYRPKQ